MRYAHPRPRPRLHGPLALLATIVLTLLATAPAAAAWPARGTRGARGAPSSGAAASATPIPDKGPVGLDAYRQLDRLPFFRRGVETREFSSFDRVGGNNDGTSSDANSAAPGGKGTCLRLDNGRCVLAETTGPGEVDTIWTVNQSTCGANEPNDGRCGPGDVRPTGNIRVVLDGQTVISASLQDVVDGKLGPPFVYPLVANYTQSAGGSYIEVPMPYRRSMLVEVDNDPYYYHVYYRTFNDAAGVATFDPAADKGLDVLATLRAAGTADPKPAQAGAVTATTPFSVPVGGSATLAREQGPGEITALRLRLPGVIGLQESAPITDDCRAFAPGAGSSAFTVKITPDNTGVRLTRRLDADVGGQTAQILVDNQPAGSWAANPTYSGGHFLNESVELPASLTAGKSQITVRNVAPQSSFDFNECYYWVDSHVPVSGADTLAHTDSLDVGNTDAANPAGEPAHGYVIVGQTFDGSRTYTYPPSGNPDVVASDDVLRHARLRISFDGQQTVDTPLGEFFGTGIERARVRGLLFGVDPDPNGYFSAWWPMPYRESAAVTLVNASGTPITGGVALVTAAPSDTWTAALDPDTGAAAPFHATAHGFAPTTPGRDWTFLDTAGEGTFVGNTQSAMGPPDNNAVAQLRNSEGYLEGDEHGFADGSRTPGVNGTGAEDYYLGAYYFLINQTLTTPFSGRPVYDSATFTPPAIDCPYHGQQGDCQTLYRLLIPDAVPFGDGLRFGIEHGGYDDAQADYSSTAYWYGRDDRTALRATDALDVGNRASEAAHRYTTADATVPYTLTDTYEGNDSGPSPQTSGTPITDDVRATTQTLSFTIAVDPANQGVMLRRMSDQSGAYQAAEVLVDGTSLGLWLEPRGNAYHKWLDDEFELPVTATAGLAQLTITLVPKPGIIAGTGSSAWTAARYTALSRVPASPQSGGMGTGGGPTATPEPGSDALYATGLAGILGGLALWRRRSGRRHGKRTSRRGKRTSRRGMHTGL